MRELVCLGKQHWISCIEFMYVFRWHCCCWFSPSRSWCRLRIFHQLWCFSFRLSNLPPPNTPKLSRVDGLCRRSAALICLLWTQTYRWANYWCKYLLCDDWSSDRQHHSFGLCKMITVEKTETFNMKLKTVIRTPTKVPVFYRGGTENMLTNVVKYYRDIILYIWNIYIT